MTKRRELRIVSAAFPITKVTYDSVLKYAENYGLTLLTTREEYFRKSQEILMRVGCREGRGYYMFHFKTYVSNEVENDKKGL